MKRLVILGALAAVMSFGGTVSVPTPAEAQNAAACKHHLTGFQRTTGPAQEAMKKNYAACLKQKK